MDKKDAKRIARLALPTCRNYWRLEDEQPEIHRAVLLLGGNFDPKYNKNKRRHHYNPHSINTLEEDLECESRSEFRYKIRDPFNPSPFRGVAMLIFWILFALILLFIALMILTTLYLGGGGSDHSDESSVDSPMEHLRNSHSIILNTIFNTKKL